ncbi:MAG: family 43 glycosylhydrolase [Mangrovibacterium sp.]
MKSNNKTSAFFLSFSGSWWGLLLLLCAFSAQAQNLRGDVAHFANPIFPGDYPDPSILIDGEDYYLVHSSFLYYPGLTIWHSKDLVNWQPVSNALTTFVGSVWAPDLVKYNDKYYIYFPVENTNYVVWADNIEGPWSEPIDLHISSIDPGHAVDKEGNRYLYWSSGDYVKLSKDGLRTESEMIHSYDGWVIPNDWSIECFCMEGPKVVKRGDFYYLTVAEGGTAGPGTGHMIVSARSKSVTGPWENSPYNAILRAESNLDQWLSLGHGTIFGDAYGDWWIMFHGYEKHHYNMGRQTMLLPIEWTSDGWWKIPDGVNVNLPVEHRPKGEKLASNFQLSDDFKGNELGLQWKFYKEYNPNRFSFHKGLCVQGKGQSMNDCSPLLVVPSDHSYMASVEVEIEGNAQAGLSLFYKEGFNSGILTDGKNVLANLRGWQFITQADVAKSKMYLRLKNYDNIVDMYYSLDGKQWIKIENSLEVEGLHHNTLSGFMSLRIGLCAIGDGAVIFRNFEYQPLNTPQ